MGRAYAGILGPLAFVAMLLRGFRHGGFAESNLVAAWLGLVAMSFVGLVTGWLANWIVEESVRGKMIAELAARQEPPQAKARTADA